MWLQSLKLICCQLFIYLGIGVDELGVAVLISNKEINEIYVFPFAGQTGSKQSILENPGVFLNPEQPLIAAVTITKDDVRRQEERVRRARQRLQEALAVA